MSTTNKDIYDLYNQYWYEAEILYHENKIAKALILAKKSLSIAKLLGSKSKIRKSEHLISVLNVYRTLGMK